MFDWNMTLAQLIAWLVSVGIASAVAYVVAQLPLSDTWKLVLSTIANAVLAAFVTAVAQLIPQTYLDSSLFNLLVAAFAFIVNWAGTVFGQVRGLETKLARKDIKFELTQ